MIQVTTCYLRRDGQVLLGQKKRGFGTGYFVGIGGRLEPDETVEQAALREIAEEVGVKAVQQDLLSMGSVTFLFPAKPEWDLHVALFQLHNWQGEIQESEEMIPAWFDPGMLPYDRMWQDARFWLPHILDGIHLEGRIVYREDNQTVGEVWLTPVS